MGESKRRKQSDPTYGHSYRNVWKPKPVSVSIGVSSLTGKFLVMVSILGTPARVISPHINKKDAVEASQEVDMKFNQIPEQTWKEFIRGKDDGFYSRLLSSLSYEDDDEILGTLEPGTPAYTAFFEAMESGNSKAMGKAVRDAHLSGNSLDRVKEMKQINDSLQKEGKDPLWSLAAIERLETVTDY
jgi:hypothetical protein